jgi:hypothetical protein
MAPDNLKATVQLGNLAVLLRRRLAEHEATI